MTILGPGYTAYALLPEIILREAAFAIESGEAGTGNHNVFN